MMINLRRSSFAIGVSAGALSMIVQTTSSHGDPGTVLAQASPVPAYRAQDAAPVIAETVSCNDLKSRLQSTGTLDVVAGQRNWSETFYGPGVPQCQFWQRPQFMYLSASDGSCGLGYICVQRITAGR